MAALAMLPALPAAYGSERVGALANESKADNLTYAGPDNVPYGMLGSWFDPATSGQGFDVTFSPNGDQSNTALLYWYTFDPAGAQKVWFLALGPIAGNSAHLQIAEPTHYQGFDHAAPAGTQNEAIGTIDFDLTDCSHAHIAWHFDRTLANGLGASNDGQADLQRLTPIVSVLCKDLCSTPLSAFGMPVGSGGDALGQCVANYDGLLTQFQSLNVNYGQCVDTVAGDEISIENLESQVSSLQADVDSAYDNGYDDGKSDGYDSGYNDGYGDGYSAGYDEGYDDGYAAGKDSGSSVASKKAVPTAPSASVEYAPRNPMRGNDAASLARVHAQQTIRAIMQQLELLKQRGARQN